MHNREARAAALVWRYCHALKHAECNIWRVLAQRNGYACFVVLSLQETKGVRQHIATPLAPLLRSKPCQCLPSFFGEHNKPAIQSFCHLWLAKGANRIAIMQKSWVVGDCLKHDNWSVVMVGSLQHNPHECQKSMFLGLRVVVQQIMATCRSECTCLALQYLGLVIFHVFTSKLVCTVGHRLSRVLYAVNFAVWCLANLSETQRLFTCGMCCLLDHMPQF